MKNISTIVLDIDDLAIGSPGLDEFIRLREHLPNLKVTFFMIPIPAALVKKTVTVAEYQDWADWLKNQDWIEICPHGMTHAPYEMKYLHGQKRLLDYETAKTFIRASERTFEQLSLPYQKIWKSPFWESSPECYRALWDEGYTVAVDRNQKKPEGGPVYVYNWSIDEPIPDYDLLKGHGHMYPPSANAIQRSFQNILKLPTDAEFKFVSEVL